MFLFLKCLQNVSIHLRQLFLAFLVTSGHCLNFGRRKATDAKKRFCRRQPKPARVIQEVIRLKALMPQAGCRIIAYTFNRRFSGSRQMTVSKTLVNKTVRMHNYEIQMLRREIKNRKPKCVPKNLVWGLDITGKTDTNNNLNHILGIVEHKSRRNLGLVASK